MWQRIFVLAGHSQWYSVEVTKYNLLVVTCSTYHVVTKNAADPTMIWSTAN
jgi:hypothetical protein